MQLPIINFGLCKMKLLLPWPVALLCGSVQAQPCGQQTPREGAKYHFHPPTKGSMDFRRKK